MTEPLSVNKILLAARTECIEDGFFIVKYPKRMCSKNRAWLHLTDRPPKFIGKRDLKTDNPWEACHFGDFWAWSADVRGLLDKPE